MGNEHVAQNTFQTTAEVNNLLKEMEQLKTLNHAMWEVMKIHGMTDGELNAALAGVIELRKHKDYEMNKNTVCPNCNNALQYSDSYDIKCIYCGTTMVMNPFQKYNEIIEREFVGDGEVTEIVEETVTETPSEEPYDITKDLRFDEI